MQPEQEEIPQPAPATFGIFAFFIWLIIAIICDIFSLIPYIGLIFSWPFAGAFFVYKWFKGFKRSNIFLMSGFNIVLEGIFSTLPASTADVVATYLMAKAKKAKQ
ncbi:MAG TPA: hypothetical protein VI937_02580 [Negativicutes bacterium]|nr:hypothetical protein [Negativicutes bacterium]